MRARFAALVAVLLSLLLLLWPSDARAADEEPPTADEHVILRTVAGDLVLTLYPSIAPKTVEQFLKLVRAGIYDTTAFVRVEPGFVAQLSAANDRTRPLNEDQRTLIRRVPGEFSAAGGPIRHVRGVLSMAREDADPDSNETSFSILLGPAPHLDGKYTVFGRIEAGPEADAVLAEILRVPRGPMLRPVVRIEVDRAEVVTSAALKETTLAPARVVAIPSDALASQTTIAMNAASNSNGNGNGSGRDITLEVALGLALAILIGLVSFFLQGRVPSSVHGSLNLVAVLVTAFVLVVVLLPQGQRHPWLAAALFFGLVGLFKVLGRFERPYAPDNQAPPPKPK